VDGIIGGDIHFYWRIPSYPASPSIIQSRGKEKSEYLKYKVRRKLLLQIAPKDTQHCSILLDFSQR
tara:strand:- start:243 stop:440 length:198 start_codon:yes stop_codon:yes gene_type:complete